MIEIIPFKAPHARWVRISRNDAQVCGDLQASDGYLLCLERSGNAFTGLNGEVMIGCGGIGLLWPGVGEAWMLLTDEVEKCKVEFHRLIVDKLKEITYSMGLHRVQAAVLMTDSRAVKWISHLGFSCEGVMKEYGPDRSDYWRFARLT